jgi:hypothetical protein
MAATEDTSDETSARCAQAKVAGNDAISCSYGLPNALPLHFARIFRHRRRFRPGELSYIRPKTAVFPLFRRVRVGSEDTQEYGFCRLRTLYDKTGPFKSRFADCIVRKTANLSWCKTNSVRYAVEAFALASALAKLHEYAGFYLLRSSPILCYSWTASRNAPLADFRCETASGFRGKSLYYLSLQI